MVEADPGRTLAASWMLPEFLEISEIFAIIFLSGISLGFSGRAAALLDSP
jgi:hypothetical protein